MPVELEQIFEGGYFRYGERNIRIQEHDFHSITALCGILKPIPIESGELSLLRFSIMNRNSVTYSRVTEQGKIFWLKAGTGTRWLVGIGEHLTTTSIEYIHQLQRIYFSLYEEHLRYSSDKIKPLKKDANGYVVKPYTEFLFVDEGPLDTPRGEKYGTRKGTEKHFQIPDDDYYLTYDCRLLIRTGNYAIWRVSEKNPLFEIKGKKFGLTLERGTNVTEEQRITAGKWLKSHLINNKVIIPGIL